MDKIVIGNDWDKELEIIWNSPGFYKFYKNILDRYKDIRVFPEQDNIFNALKLTSFNDVKVVIIGQDPYHEFGQAIGLSFSVNKTCKIPSSLQNIYKELYNDLQIEPAKNGDLTKWAQEGVLLLNTILTVEEGKVLSHKGLGWEKLTDYIIKKLNKREKPIVFILWGNFARAKKDLITNPNHLVIESVHPSGLSAHRGFFGSKPFSKTNEFLKENNIEPINWDLK